MDGAFSVFPVSSLEKVFPDERPGGVVCTGGTALRNERHAFQVAWRWAAHTLDDVAVTVDSGLERFIRLYEVGLAPSDLPNWHACDDVLRRAPGLFPDPLYEIGARTISLLPDQWRAVWVEIDGTAGDLPVGSHDVEIVFSHGMGDARQELGRAGYRLEVLAAALPPQTVCHTEWFHADCLANHYGDAVFSEAHWHRIEQFVAMATAHGIDTLLTPLFTPPLDTAEGGERTTVQLVGVRILSGTGADAIYRFGFERLDRWLEMGDRLGVRFFEMSHLFTQWGAAHAPKIHAVHADGSTVRAFGWDTDAGGPEYATFLGQFLPVLVDHLVEKGYGGRILFHVSDEPSLHHLESYRSAASLLKRHIGDLPVIDALSDFDFYAHGLVENPVPANNHIKSFLEAGVPNLWVYYCCAQGEKVANRFFSMPSYRNRILGMQMFRHDIKGFLQWGYNFYNTRWSLRAIDSFRVTDAGGAFPSGDAFLVYPGEDGPVPSLRIKVLADAFQDLRALQALAAEIGRDAVVRMMEEGLSEPIAFDVYPRSAAWLLATRERINRALAGS